MTLPRLVADVRTGHTGFEMATVDGMYAAATPPQAQSVAGRTAGPGAAPASRATGEARCRSARNRRYDSYCVPGSGGWVVSYPPVWPAHQPAGC